MFNHQSIKKFQINNLIYDISCTYKRYQTVVMENLKNQKRPTQEEAEKLKFCNIYCYKVQNQITQQFAKV
jgi:hypothetical protein